MGDTLDTLFNIAETISPLPLAPYRALVDEEKAKEVAKAAAGVAISAGLSATGAGFAKFAIKRLRGKEVHHLLPLRTFRKFVRVPGMLQSKAVDALSKQAACQADVMKKTASLLPYLWIHPALATYVMAESMACMIPDLPAKTGSLGKQVIRNAGRLAAGMTAVYQPLTQQEPQSMEDMLLDVILGPSSLLFQ